MKKYEKMSKSRGNVVLPEEVVYGVREVENGYEFRDVNGNVVNYNEINIWKDPQIGFYFTGTRFGKQPVFTCLKGDPVPCIFSINGKNLIQHPYLKEFWATIIEKYFPEGKIYIWPDELLAQFEALNKDDKK